MKDGLDYAEMLGLTVSSCDVVVKPSKKRRKNNVKEQVITKVNSEDVKNEPSDNLDNFTDVTPKRKFKFDILYIEGLAVFVLVVAILLTNIFWEDSGINRIFKKAFGEVTTVETDARTYLSFNASAPSYDLDAEMDNGVMLYSGKGSLYPVCDGKVSSVVEEDGKYTLTISHSDKFKTVISGVDFVYADKGEDVFKYIPVCYLNGGSAKVYLYNEDALVTNYIVENGSLVWEN